MGKAGLEQGHSICKAQVSFQAFAHHLFTSQGRCHNQVKIASAHTPASAEWFYISSRYKAALGVTTQCRDWEEKSAWKCSQAPLCLQHPSDRLLTLSGHSPTAMLPIWRGLCPGGLAPREEVSPDCTATWLLRVTDECNHPVLSPVWFTEHLRYWSFSLWWCLGKGVQL